jgi:hypothetical protein
MFPGFIRICVLMALHLIKLCVGCDSIAELSDWQSLRQKQQRAKEKKPELVHITRMTPKRSAELLDGGSLYWVIKGFIAVRQRLVAIRAVRRGGVPHCGLVYDKALIAVSPRPRRPFQGWRYLDGVDAPPDLPRGQGGDDLPEHLRRELAVLGLL